MDLLLAANSVPLSSADTPPTTGTPQYASSGVPGLVAPTVWPAYWFNSLAKELVVGLIQGAGIVPDRNNNGQIIAAILALINNSRPPLAMTVYGTPGSFNFVSPANRSSVLRVRLVGAGGGSGFCVAMGAGAGGGAGGYAEAIVGVAASTTVPITVGAPGAGQINAGASGTQGGTSAFGVFATATGGMPGNTAGSISSGGYPGTGSLQSGLAGLALNGGYGSDGAGGGMTGFGNGGDSFFGGGGRAGIGGPGNAGLAPGSGGGGPYANANNGSMGAPGLVVVEVIG